MRKNGVARTFEPLGECAVLANGFTREKPAFSRLAPATITHLLSTISTGVEEQNAFAVPSMSSELEA